MKDPSVGRFSREDRKQRGQTADGSVTHAASEADIRRQLERILGHPAFDASDRMRAFLAYVVEEALAGRGDRIKAFSIAQDVFGRDASFDAHSDPLVRVEAGHLRRSLERYYLKAGGTDPSSSRSRRAAMSRRSRCGGPRQARHRPPGVGPGAGPSVPPVPLWLPLPWQPSSICNCKRLAPQSPIFRGLSSFLSRRPTRKTDQRRSPGA